jgi:AcrR family transcriptional regulator
LASDTARSNSDGPSAGISIRTRRVQARQGSSPEYVDRRNKIIAAAIRIFSSKGVDRASVNEISDAAGVDRASFYYYFATKQELFMTLIAEVGEELGSSAERIASSSQSSADRLREIIETLMVKYEKHYPIMYFYVQQDTRHMPHGRRRTEIESRRQRYDAALEKIISDGMQSGEFREGIDIDVLRLAMLGAVNWTHRWFVPGRRLTGQEVGAAMASLFLNGLLAN